MLSNTGPDFSHIDPRDELTRLAPMLAQHRATLQTLLAQPHYTYNNLVEPLEALSNELHQLWSPINHLHSVNNDPSWRDVFSEAELLLADYNSELSQHIGLANAFDMIKKDSEFKMLTPVQQRIIDLNIRDFTLSGIHLPEKEKQQYAEIQRRLCELSTQFENHVLDATRAWTHTVTSVDTLQGMPAHSIAAAKQTDEDVWVLTLDFPCFHAVMTYADDRALRELVYQAYVTRASDQGPHDKVYDNSTTMTDIINERAKLAKLLNFSHYTELSIATKMVSNVSEVTEFLENLAKKAKPKALQELAELEGFANKQLGIPNLEPWDIAYASEKLQTKLYAFDSEQIRQYFPEDKVLSGLFSTIQNLFSINVSPCDDMSIWHPDVKTFQLLDKTGTCIAKCYMDLYARPQKRGGAWMDDCQSRYRLADGNLQLPIAYLTANFTPPQPGEPAYFTHDEVLTLFHEMGHGLQHMLTQIDSLSVSGINEVEWDAVELPSQFFENFCWTDEGLIACSSHKETQEPLPQKLRQQLVAAKQFQTGLQLIRQLQFALFDWRLHQLTAPVTITHINALWEAVHQQIAVAPYKPYQRIPQQFSHVFAGGYAAGYYSYKWAEVLACDAFAAFVEPGADKQVQGQHFRDTILALGGAKPAAEVYRAFRGRDATIDALLVQEGLVI
jgi:oligopeptidase A